MTYDRAKLEALDWLWPCPGARFKLMRKDKLEVGIIGYTGVCTVLDVGESELAKGCWVTYTLLAEGGNAFNRCNGTARSTASLFRWWGWLNDGTLQPL